MIARLAVAMLPVPLLFGGPEFDRKPHLRGGLPGGPPGERLLLRMEQRNPQEYERLCELRKTDPEAFRDALRKHGKAGFRPPREGRRHAKELSQLAAQVRKEPDADKRAALTQQLQQKIGESFDAEIAEHQQRLEAMSRRLEERRQQKAEICQKMAGKLLEHRD